VTLDDRFRSQVEYCLGRPLEVADLPSAASVKDLDARAIENIRRIAEEGLPLAVVYVRAIVNSLTVPEALRFLEEIGAA